MTIYRTLSELAQLIEKKAIDMNLEDNSISKVDNYLNIIIRLASSFIHLAHYETGKDYDELKNAILNNISDYSDRTKEMSFKMNQAMRSKVENNS